MAEATKQIGWDQLVRTHDPRHDTEREVEYVFGNGQAIKTKPQDRPGSNYRWYGEDNS